MVAVASSQVAADASAVIKVSSMRERIRRRSGSTSDSYSPIDDRREKITRARVSQILRLRCLSDRLVEDLRQVERTGPVPGEADLRKVAGLPRGEQWARYEEVLREQGTGKRARGSGSEAAR